MTRASLGPHTSIPMSKHMFETLLLGCCCQMFPRVHTDTSPVSCPASLHHPAPAPPEPVPPSAAPTHVETCGRPCSPPVSIWIPPLPVTKMGTVMETMLTWCPLRHPGATRPGIIGVCAEWPVMTRETKQAPTLPQHSASHQSQHGGRVTNGAS